jgi:hypothetical protein
MCQDEEPLIIPEIRVWIHQVGKDDDYEVFKSFEEAIWFILRNDNAERQPMLAFAGYEFNLYGIQKEEVKPKCGRPKKKNG